MHLHQQELLLAKLSLSQVEQALEGLYHEREPQDPLLQELRFEASSHPCRSWSRSAAVGHQGPSQKRWPLWSRGSGTPTTELTGRSASRYSRPMGVVRSTPFQ